ncbi:MAG: acyl-[acyl-carrier-protein] thioesterase [Prevotellaceae bacterium]|jgi:acyl-ACP thioesterase|nr:acyl-[acyl-carrier-protein] thioesterase [Prevotellaceae bacterium]
MNKTGTYKFTIDSYLTDFQGKVTLSFMVNLLMHVATRHADERGFGYSYVRSLNRAWVLSRLVIEMYEYPTIDSEISITTWVAGVNKFFTERHFSFRNADNKTVGHAKSIWASINVATRRPENVMEMYGLTDFVTEGENPIQNIRKIPQLKDRQPVGKFTVRYSDIDINNHLNSVKYVEHFVDMFDVQRFNKMEIRRMEIHFASEAIFGQRLFLLKKEEEQNVFALEMRDEAKLISAARITWAEHIL